MRKACHNYPDCKHEALPPNVRCQHCMDKLTISAARASQLSKPRFIQIACSSSQDGNENLYAVDDEGRVWWYKFNAKKWDELRWVSDSV